MTVLSHTAKTVLLICAIAMAAVVLPGDSSLVWATGALVALAGALLGSFGKQPTSTVSHE
ncbi:MAG: hypothetical protein QNJ87_10440 [Gammaproteobacteria bacterium]|nr:hypothetical protein [Gammaproteobacteria bacterium]